MPRPSSYSPPDRWKSIVWRRVTLICETAYPTIQFVGQLTPLYNLRDSLLYHTICGTACSSIQLVGPPRPSCSTKQYLLHLSIACPLSFHVLSILKAYMYAIHTVIQCSHSSKQCVLSSKCFICSAPLKKQLRCLTQMRFAVKLSSLIVSKSAQLWGSNTFPVV